MTSQEQAVVARLRELAIPFTRHEHPPAATVEQAEQYWADIDATHCKNLFLRNQKGTRHYLVILVAAKKADLRAVADQIGDGKLSFASPERMMTHLGLAPGSVSPFGLIHDRDRQVRVALDRDLKSASRQVGQSAFGGRPSSSPPGKVIQSPSTVCGDSCASSLILWRV